MSDDRAHVLDMLDAARAIQRFVNGAGQDAFFRDDLLQSAVLHKFLILGQACRRVSNGFRAAHPDVTWSGIIGFRNQIVHEYDEVNLDVVWTIVHDDLPKAIEALARIVPENPDGEAEDN
jgi:uncharacterized protein with HEPN domain